MESLFSAYALGEAFLVFNTSGEKPKPDTATVSGRGMQTTKALAKTHTVTVQDMQGVVQSNVQFYNDMLSSSAKYDFYYFTPNRIWDASGNYVTVIGDPVITAELNTYQMADVSIQWVSKGNPLPFDFDTDTFLEGLYYDVEIQTGSTFNTNVWSVSSGTYSVDMTATLNHPLVGVDSPNWSIVQLANSANITDISLAIDSAGTVDFVAGVGDSGTYLFTIIAESPSGCVFGEYQVTIIVA
jgi:hypothetical protein